MADVLTVLLNAGVPKTEVFGLLMVALLVLAFGAAAFVGWRAERRSSSRRSAYSASAAPRFHSLESQAV